MKLYFLIPLFFIFSCSSTEVKIPADILSKEKMIDLYVDVHISDAIAINKKLKEVKLSNQLKKSYLVSVLKKHNVTMAEYEKSNAFYEENIDLMYEVYEDVMKKISEKEALNEGDNVKEKKGKELKKKKTK